MTQPPLSALVLLIIGLVLPVAILRCVSAEQRDAVAPVICQGLAIAPFTHRKLRSLTLGEIEDLEKALSRCAAPKVEPEATTPTVQTFNDLGDAGVVLP